MNRLNTSQSVQLFELIVFTIVSGVVSAPAGWPLSHWFLEVLDGPNVNGLLAAAGFVVAYASVFFLPRSEQKGSISPFWLSIYPVALALSGVGASLGTSSLARSWWFDPLYSFVLGAGAIGGFAVILGIGITPTLLVIARRLRRHTDARILTKIVTLMDEIERNPRRWEELSFRVHLAKELDAIASLIENGLPAAYSDKDESFQRWMSVRSRRIAAHIRDLKSWLAIPRQDTREYLLQSLGRIVICLGLGDWDGIPAGNPASGDQSPGRIATLLSTGRTLLASALPIGVLIVLHALDRDPPLQMRGYLTFGAAAWLTVGCISLLDPLYSSRLEALKSALQVLPGLKKD